MYVHCSMYCTCRLLIHIPGDAFGLKKFLEMEQEMKRYLDKKMQSHKLSFDPNNIRDYIDCFMQEENRRNQENSGKQHFFNGSQCCLMQTTYCNFTN